MKNWISILLIIAILILVNLIAGQFFFRLDVTGDKEYTLSSATTDILRQLDDPITVEAYFSKDLPPNFVKVQNDFRDLLGEYEARSRGMVEYEFIDPSTDPELETKAAQNGIQPVLINVREKDQVKNQKAFLGAVIRMGEVSEAIPVLQPGAAMEYALTTAIKKMSVLDKPAIGIVQGHGEPQIQQLAQVYQGLSILYSVEALDLSAEVEIPGRFATIAIVAPRDSFPAADLQKLDDYLARGGNMLMALDAVQGDFSTAAGSAISTGLETWLAGKGARIHNSFVVDASSGSVSVQQRQGFFTINTPVQFPYFPLIKSFRDHPVTKGLSQVMFQFASPIRPSGDTSYRFEPFLTTSERAGIINPPTYFDVANKKWTARDFPESNIPLGVILSRSGSDAPASKIILYSDGEFGVSGQQGRGQSPDHINLLVNSIDWLSDDTGLIDLRTKGRTSRPIKELDDGERQTIKWLNFLLPIALVIVYGIFRSQVKRNRRIRRMQEDFS